MARRRRRALWDVRLMDADRLAMGWTNTDLAAAAALSPATVTRFLSRQYQSPRVAKRLATALGQETARYLRPSREAAA